MKTKLLSLCILITLSLQIQSQTTYDYLSRPGLTIGSEHFNFFDGTYNNSFQFVGDTLLCNENLLIFQHVNPPFTQQFLRVEGGKVWKKSFNPCDSEVLIYDFDLEIGETTDAFYFNDYHVIDIQTITLLNGEERKHIILQYNNSSITSEWVDGIGSLNNGLFIIPDFEGSTSLVCVKENHEMIWLNPNQSTELCDSISCFTPVSNFDFEVDLFQVNFENQSVYYSSILWDFGDGETSTELHPSHIYTNPGCYNVTLTLSSDCLNGTFEKRLSVPVCIAQEWEIKSPDLTTGSLKVDFVNESVGWAIGLKQIWKTEDGGINWAEQNYPIPSSPINRTLTSIDMVDEMNGVISTFNYGAPSSIEAFLVTNDGGITWEEKMPGSYFVISAIMTDDGQVFGSGQFDGVFYSNDWGNSFTELPTPGADFTQFQYLGNNEVVAIGLQGLPPAATRLISYSDDSGQNWIHNLLPNDYYRASGFHFFNENEGYVCGFEGFLIKTEDGGQSWQEIPYNDERLASRIYFIDEQTGWAVGSDGLVLSTTDGGDTWLVGNCGYQNNLLSISALDAENCWLGSGHGKYLELNLDAETNCPTVNIDNLNLENNDLLIFPNPAFELVTINLSKPVVSNETTKIIIYNNLGQNIFEGNILNETLSINTEAWNSGIYWVQFFRNEKLRGIEKLVIID